jgi:hypothetical protein
MGAPDPEYNGRNTRGADRNHSQWGAHRVTSHPEPYVGERVASSVELRDGARKPFEKIRAGLLYDARITDSLIYRRPSLAHGASSFFNVSVLWAACCE